MLVTFQVLIPYYVVETGVCKRVKENLSNNESFLMGPALLLPQVFLFSHFPLIGLYFPRIFAWLRFHYSYISSHVTL